MTSQNAVPNRAILWQIFWYSLTQALHTVGTSKWAAYDFPFHGAAHGFAEDLFFESFGITWTEWLKRSRVVMGQQDSQHQLSTYNQVLQYYHLSPCLLDPMSSRCAGCTLAVGRFFHCCNRPSGIGISIGTASGPWPRTQSSADPAGLPNTKVGVKTKPYSLVWITESWCPKFHALS